MLVRSAKGRCENRHRAGIGCERPMEYLPLIIYAVTFSSCQQSARLYLGGFGDTNGHASGGRGTATGCAKRSASSPYRTCARRKLAGLFVAAMRWRSYEDRHNRLRCDRWSPTAARNRGGCASADRDREDRGPHRAGPGRGRSCSWAPMISSSRCIPPLDDRMSATSS
jgi:hypothetical protein